MRMMQGLDDATRASKQRELKELQDEVRRT
jgi:hypothetical protein